MENVLPGRVGGVARVRNAGVSGSGTIARSDQRQAGEPRASSVDSCEMRAKGENEADSECLATAPMRASD